MSGESLVNEARALWADHPVMLRGIERWASDREGPLWRRSKGSRLTILQVIVQAGRERAAAGHGGVQGVLIQ